MVVTIHRLWLLVIAALLAASLGPPAHAQPPMESSLGSRPLPAVVGMSGQGRSYFGVSLNKVSTVHPYESVCGQVTYVKHEEDTDWHLKISDGPHFIVGEIMSEIPLPTPKVGQWIRAAGVTRWDDLHKWWELHPLTAISVVSSCKTR